MDKKRTLFEVVAEGDDKQLEQLLLEGKDERNVATLAVSLNFLIPLNSILIKISLNASSTGTQFCMKLLGKDIQGVPNYCAMFIRRKNKLHNVRRN